MSALSGGESIAYVYVFVHKIQTKAPPLNKQAVMGLRPILGNTVVATGVWFATQHAEDVGAYSIYPANLSCSNSICGYVYDLFL